MIKAPKFNAVALLAVVLCGCAATLQHLRPQCASAADNNVRVRRLHNHHQLRFQRNEGDDATAPSATDSGRGEGGLLKGGRRRLGSGSSGKGSKSKSSKCGGKGGKGGKGSSKSKSGKGGTSKSKSSKSKSSGCPEDDGGYCSCQSCTREVLDREVGAFTCGERIERLLDEHPGAFPTGKKACRRVAGLEFPRECGECDPDTCDGRVAVTDEPDFYCGCDSCTKNVWDRDARGFTCGSRITWATIVEQESEEDACFQVANRYDECKRCDPARCASPQQQEDANNGKEEDAVNEEDNTNSGKEENIEDDGKDTKVDEPEAAEAPTFRCACADCTADIWNEEAPPGAGADFTCGKRIEFMMTQGLSEFEACQSVAGVNSDHADSCGPACDPDRCNGRVTSPPEAPLYCFRDSQDRVRYENVWGKHEVHVKRHKDNDVCGPSDNRFSEDTVSLEGDELTLRFEKTADGWVGSEVRVLLPEDEMPYTYGNYRFSVKDVVVKDKVTGAVNATCLPPSLVLGLFTWDTTDIYDVNEYWSHEVDIEISRWGNRDIMDAQFVIQPPVEPHYMRFWTGVDETMDQGGRVHQFDWGPTNVTWRSDANGGTRLEYTTEQAAAAGLTDRIQCLPADIEVRMNLWNIGGTSQPMDMLDSQVVEVVIDSFSFEPSGVDGVVDGSLCSKDCQCISSHCMNGVCTAL